MLEPAAAAVSEEYPFSTGPACIHSKARREKNCHISMSSLRSSSEQETNAATAAAVLFKCMWSGECRSETSLRFSHSGGEDAAAGGTILHFGLYCTVVAVKLRHLNMLDDNPEGPIWLPASEQKTPTCMSCLQPSVLQKRVINSPISFFISFRGRTET